VAGEGETGACGGLPGAREGCEEQRVLERGHRQSDERAVDLHLF